MNDLILLDTNFLINGLVKDSSESRKLVDWFHSGQPLVTSAIVWYEFVCGPVNEQHIQLMRAFLSDQKAFRSIIPFDMIIAEKTALLFNQLGRPRRMRVDAMIAMTAIEIEASLATANVRDFEPMVPFGLKLLK